jgi:hypothetical protein
MELNDGIKVDITLKEDGGGKHQVLFSLGSVIQMELTPRQARVLATELIQVASRAEVRGNFKSGHHLSREAVTQAGGPFQLVFSK